MRTNRFSFFVLGASLSVLLACAPPYSNFAARTPKSIGSSVEVPQDPFASRGKVLFHEGEVGAAGLRNELAAGTELAITLGNSCDHPGEISRLVAGAKDFPANTGKSVTSYTWRLPRAYDLSELKILAEADTCVVGLSESARFRVSALPNDPRVAEEDHLRSIEAAAAYDILYSALVAKPVVIAVIDTGIDVDHADLKGVLWRNSREIEGNNVDDDRNGYIDDVNGYNFADRVPSPRQTGTWSANGHGTHVSGLAAAQGDNGIGVTGIMGRGAKIMMLNVFGRDEGAYVSDIANALRYAADNGADVINMSIGGSGRNATYEAALGYAVKKGATVIVAAGNDASEIGGDDFQSPASYSPLFQGMLAIASTDSSTGKISKYSNFSSQFVELSAPGSEESDRRRGLLSTYPGGSYARLQGTSMASPVAAGAAGLAVGMLRARGYTPSPSMIEDILNTSAVRDPRLASQVQGGRALNLRAMAEFIQKSYPPR